MFAITYKDNVHELIAAGASLELLASILVLGLGFLCARGAAAVWWSGRVAIVLTALSPAALFVKPIRSSFLASLLSAGRVQGLTAGGALLVGGLGLFSSAGFALLFLYYRGIHCGRAGQLNPAGASPTTGHPGCWSARLTPWPSRFCDTKSQFTTCLSTVSANRGRSLR